MKKWEQCVKCDKRVPARQVYVREYIKTHVRTENKKFLNQYGNWGKKAKFRTRWTVIGWRCPECHTIVPTNTIAGASGTPTI